MNKICRNAKNYKLTEGGIYEVVEQDGNYIKIVNDNGKLVRYDFSLFEDITETVIPEEIIPPTPVIRTEAQIIESLNYDRLTRTITYNDRDNNLVTFHFNELWSITNSSNSCGTTQFDGLNNVMSIIESNVSSEHEDYILLKQTIFKLVINEILGYERVTNSKGLVIFSTNQNDNFEDYYTTLSQMSLSSTNWFHNPNSGNQICVWCLGTNGF